MRFIYDYWGWAFPLAILSLMVFAAVGAEHINHPAQCIRVSDGKVFPATAFYTNQRLKHYKVVVGDMKYTFLPEVNREGVWECRKMRSAKTANPDTAEITI